MNGIFSIISRIIVGVICGLTSILIGCTAANSDDESKTVDYELAHGYFVRNDASEAIPALYTTQAEFDSIFGAAAVMGENGLPTRIDFEKQSVVAVATPVTDMDTEIEAQSLEAKGDELVLHYKVVKGDSLGYFIRPCLILVIDKYPRASKVVLTQE